MLRNVPIKDHWAEQRIFVRRAIVATVLVSLLAILLLGRLFVLQVLNFEHFQDLSFGNRIRIEPVPPTRGLIFDRNGVLLAENVPAYQLELTPEQVPDIEDTLRRLTALGLLREQDMDRVRSTLKAKRRFDSVPLRFRLTDEEVARFAVKRPLFPGVDIRARLARHYPLADSAVHAVGYVSSISEDDLERLDAAAYAGTTHVGKTGVEKNYEHLLHGEAGYLQVLVNATGRALQVIPGKAPVPGQDLFLTLDVRMQLAAEQALGDYKGAVVAIDPRDGGVLALASTPAYDPNPFGEGLSRAEFRALSSDTAKPLFNRALRGQYPPGSTIKPILGLAGLHFHAEHAHKETMCTGSFSLPGNDHRYRDWKRGGHGPMDLISSIEQSCDVYFYQLADELGITRMHDFLALFGFGETTGIDIQGEKSGLLPSPEWKRRNFRNPADRVWFPGETVITGIGQGFMLTTPLQLAHSTAIVAARGENYRPILVDSVRDPVSGTVTTRPHRRLDPVIVADEMMWNVVSDAMEAVVHGEQGTARAIGVDAGYRIAGKTGTAQVFTVAQEEEYDEEALERELHDHALFVAYAPADAPEVAIAVLVENGGSGSRTAAPVARAVLDAYFGDSPGGIAAR